MSKIEISSGDGLVAVGCGVAMPVHVDYRYSDDRLPGVIVGVDALYEPSLRKYVLNRLNFVRAVPEIELTGTLLRTVPVHELLKLAAARARVKPINQGAFKSQLAGEFAPENPAALVAQGPSTETLTVVARHYRVAEVIGVKPALYLQGILNIPYPTVSNWISRAKNAGLFPTDVSIDADAQALKDRFPAEVDEGQKLYAELQKWGLP